MAKTHSQSDVTVFNQEGPAKHLVHGDDLGIKAPGGNSRDCAASQTGVPVNLSSRQLNE